MRKKLTGGFVTLVLGIVMVAGSVVGKSTLSADEMSPATFQTITLSLFIGVALIILSAILFIKASSVERR
ncbi:MAG: hypothetical protein Q7S37_01280 [bacterium]|nr:hypothetical protein [bacterium]